MAWHLDATHPGPWTGCYPAAIAATVIQHSWQLYTLGHSADIPIATPSWDVTVDADLLRSPNATLKAKVGGNGWPVIGSWVRLDVSWMIDGAKTGTLFWGMVTRTTRHRPHGGTTTAYVEIEAQSAEVVYDFPSNATHAISNSYTRCDQAALGNVTWKPLPIGYHNVSLNTPTAGQLAAYRAMEITPGDNLDSFIHVMAESLGQRARGDYRKLGSSAAGYIISPREPDSDTPLDLTDLATNWSETCDIADVATAVDVTAQWVSGGDNKQSRRIYGGPGDLYTRAKQVSIPMKPTGGSLGASDPTALAYLASVTLWPYRQTFTCRAIWWLDLLHQVAAGGLYARVVAITWLVDTGVMTVTAARPED